MSTASAQLNLFSRPARPVAPDTAEMVVDGFAGFGGASEGIEQALGTAVDAAINHNPAAVQLHQFNHPATRHYCQDIFDVDPREVVGERRLGLLWVSPDCTHHSKARGGRPKSKKLRGLANRALLWVRLCRPRVLILENVEEFEGWCRLDKRTGQADPQRTGELFMKFVRRLRQHGYEVEWNVLNAADYGAGTARYRLFLIARCDGQPIVWPDPTHGPGREQPWMTAAECIDWSDLGHSIFLTPEQARRVGCRRPLAEHTQRRIANGMVRYVLEAKQPFILRTGHFSNITGAGHHFRGQGLDKPLRTICQTNDKALVVPQLVKYHGLKANETRGQTVDHPLRTIDTQNRFALVSAFMAKYYGTATGQGVDRSLGSITAQGQKYGLVAATLLKNNHGSNCVDITDPLHTITTGGRHGLVAGNFGVPETADLGRAEMAAAFLLKYYGTAIGQHLTRPLDTITGRARFGLVTVTIGGEPLILCDILLRMLKPRELLRAQFGEFAGDYRLAGSIAAQISGIGNSVPPHPARALVAANFKREEAA